MTALVLSPAAAAAPAARRLAAQTRLELALLLRNGEQLLLTIVIPTVVLLLFAKLPIVDIHGPRVDFVLPGVLALAVLSTAFTGQAIATGFERRYGVLKRLGATPLPRWGLLAAKTLAVLAVEALQVALLIGVGFALGWSPHGSGAPVAGLLVLGTAAFSGLGLLMAGTLRAEATLAAANGIYLVLLLLGGIVFPLSRLPGALQGFAKVLPSTALATGLRRVLEAGASMPWGDLGLLALWAGVAGVLAARTFRWE